MSDTKELQEDLRKIGVALVSSGLVSLIVTEKATLTWPLILLFSGVTIWVCGLVKRRKFL